MIKTSNKFPRQGWKEAFEKNAKKDDVFIEIPESSLDEAEWEWDLLGHCEESSTKQSSS